MSKYRKTITAVIAAILSITMYSCQSDGPNGSGMNYGKMKLGRMNLDRAKRLALVAGGDQSRAIDGEYLSAGLYKIDDKGNISAVGVYFTTDTLGNKLEKEYALKVAPKSLFQLTKDYALAIFCDYYDSDGDVVEDKWVEGKDEKLIFVKQDVPYKNLLIRLSDGKIWCVDNILDKFITNADNPLAEQHSLTGNWKLDKNGVLYLNGAYRFNLSTDDASFEQIIPGEGYPDKEFQDYHIADNGVIWSYHSALMTLNWPKTGFQNLNKSDLSESVYPKNERYINAIGEEVSTKDDAEYTFYRRAYHPSDIYFVNIDENPGVIIFSNYYISRDRIPAFLYEFFDDNIASYHDITIGSTPGSAKLKENPIIIGKANGRLANHEYGFYTNSISIFTGKDFILISEGRRISKIDLKKREWTILKTLEFDINFNVSSREYAGKIWNMSDDPFGADWFDVYTQETGFVAFNANIPEWMHSGYDISDGYLRYSGTNPANYNYEEILIDITTGEATYDMIAPKYQFETLINLN